MLSRLLRLLPAYDWPRLLTAPPRQSELLSDVRREAMDRLASRLRPVVVDPSSFSYPRPEQPLTRTVPVPEFLMYEFVGNAAGTYTVHIGGTPTRQRRLRRLRRLLHRRPHLHPRWLYPTTWPGSRQPVGWWRRAS